MSEQQEPSSGMSPRRFWLSLLLLALGAIAWRAATAAAYDAGHPLADYPVIDEDSYDKMGLEIAAGDWLGKEIFFQEPLYGYWLGLVYGLSGDGPERLQNVRYLQALLGGLSTVLVGLLARELFGKRVGLVAAAMLALYRPAVFYSVLILKPNLVLPIWTLLALAIVRSKRLGLTNARALGIGFLGGLGALLRGNMLLMLPPIGLIPLFRQWGSRSESEARPEPLRGCVGVS